MSLTVGELVSQIILKKRLVFFEHYTNCIKLFVKYQNL